MPTTSNFGWTTPADTDLVKDGAAAIRTLGNGIDTSLVDLKGGTTGQILSKNSNTDLDYTWINNDQGDITEVQAGTGISVASGTGPVPVVTNTVATTFDAKGDLVVGTGADTFAELTVGTNGHTLVADSAETTGLKWAAPAGGKVLQVVTATTTTATSITTTSYADVTNITLSITPTSASSTILIIWSSSVYGSISSYDDALPTVSHQLLRGVTAVATDNRIMSNSSSATGGNGRDHTQAFAFHYIDSPATTSSTTYKFQAKRTTPGGTTSVSIGANSYNQTITALEIGA